MTFMDRDIGLEDAYGVEGPEENRELYERWASTYEDSFIAAEGYRYHERIARLFVDAGGTGPILDLGCGTGLVGAEIARRGVGPIDGVDISPAMLEQAAQKLLDGDRVYRRLLEADLTGALPLESGVYPGLVSAGTFTHGHLGPESLDESVRVAGRGALGIVGINSAHYVDMGFGDHLEMLRKRGLIAALRLIDIPIYEDTGSDDPDRRSLVAMFRVA